MSADAVVEPTVETKEYLLTIRIKFQAFDDAEARKEATNTLLDMFAMEINAETGEAKVAEGMEVKFQRLKKDGAPEKVEL